MTGKFDFTEIKERYKFFLEKAGDRGTRVLPFYEVELWDRVLNDVDKRVFEDIRYVGVPLYPIFPVSETQYLNFANPFVKVGIEIEYKQSPKDLIKRKIEFLKSGGWTIYIITSKNSYHTIEEFFRIKRKRKDVEYEDLTASQQYGFVKKYHADNCRCLVEYIKHTHFSNEYGQLYAQG